MQQQRGGVDTHTARPAGYDEAIAERVLEKISEGGLLMKICQEPGMPTRAQFYSWMASRPALRDAYARARLQWADWHAEKVVDIAQDPRGNIVDEKGNRLPLTHEEVGARRLHIDSIKWLVGKWAPRTYGERPQPTPELEQQVVSITRRIVYPERRPEDDLPRLPRPSAPNLPAVAGPLPEVVQERLHKILMKRVRINNAPANPYAVWDEVATVIDSALAAHYGTAVEKQWVTVCETYL
jgi:hypothetical protein